MERLIAGIQALADEWGEVDVATDEDSLRLRMTPAPGLRTFLKVERQPAAPFSGLCKVECCTLVSNVDPEDDELSRFLDIANSSAFGGAWEMYGEGDVGVTGQLLVADTSDPHLPALVGQLFALQVEDAVTVGRPVGSVGFEDLHDPTRPPVQATFHRVPDLSQVSEALRWRSAYHESQRWIIDRIDEREATILAPMLVNEPVRLDGGELADNLRRLTLALATHPRRGPGVLLQVTLRDDAQEDAIGFRNWGIATQSGRWFGTGLGGLTLWSGDGPTEPVYRAFLPLDLLGVLDDDSAIDLVVDAALGAINVTGIAEAIFAALAAADSLEALERAVDERQRVLHRQYRASALRAATHLRRRDDDLANPDCPLVDVGRAVLDRLAVDQLQIRTAPHLLSDDGFAWLPGPYVQRVEATPMRPSRGLEVAEVSVTTELGLAPTADHTRLGRLCVELMTKLPLCSLIFSEDGQVQLTSTVMVHEGVWWHRAELLAIVAALQLNCAEDIRSSFDLERITTDPASSLRDLLEAQGPVDGYDAIFEVVPDLKELNAMRDVGVEDLIAITETRLLDRPFSRLFGELDDDPDPVVLLHGNYRDGGWDPPLGETMVVLEAMDHNLVGDAVKVVVNPGFLPADPDLFAEALRLTAFTHREGGVAICPSWQITGRTVSATIVVPKIAITPPGLDTGAEIVMQAVDSCLHALAQAVISSAETFPGFDRSQVNLTRASPAGDQRPGAEPATAAWAPWPGVRILAFPAGGEEIEHWNDVSLSIEAAEALIQWMTGADNALLFEHPGTELKAERDASGPVLHVAGQTMPLNDTVVQALRLQLERPEGPATGRLPGRIVTYPIADLIDGDGDTVLVVPPADALTTIIGSDHVACDGVGAVTSSSLWLHFRSDVGEFDLDLSPDLAGQLIDSATHDRTVPLVVAFPGVDGRVTETPPSAFLGTLLATEIEAGLAEMRRFDQ